MSTEQERCSICHPKTRNPVVWFFRLLRAFWGELFLESGPRTRRDGQGGVIVDEPLSNMHRHISAEELHGMEVKKRFAVFGLLGEEPEAEDALLRKQAENEVAKESKEELPWPETELVLDTPLRREYAGLLGSKSRRLEYLYDNWEKLEGGGKPKGRAPAPEFPTDTLLTTAEAKQPMQPACIPGSEVILHDPVLESRLTEKAEVVGHPVYLIGAEAEAEAATGKPEPTPEPQRGGQQAKALYAMMADVEAGMTPK